MDRMKTTVKFHILNERITQHTIQKGLRVHQVQFKASLEAIFYLGATILLAIHGMLVLKHCHYHSVHHLVVPSLIQKMSYLDGKKIRNHVYKQRRVDMHCVYCCGTLCECENIIQWGPNCWYGVEGIKVWKQFLSLMGKVDYAIGDNINHVCRAHYRRIYEFRNMRTCSVHTSKESSNWKLICNIVNLPDKICEAFFLEPQTVQCFD